MDDEIYIKAESPGAKEIHGMFDGPILPLALRLSIPFFISNIIGLLYLVIDTYFITLIDRGSTALISGTGLVFPVYFLFLALGMGINIGVSSLVARAIGERNQPALERAADSGLLIAAVIAVATLTLGYVFGGDILHFLAGSKLSEEAIGHGMRFFYFILPALGLLLLGHVLLGVLQGEGLTRYIATASVLSAVVNIALDPVLIFYFDMGVAGAGLATTLGIASAGVYVISIFVKKKSSIPIHWDLTRASARLIGEIIRVGSVQSLQMAAMSVTFMFLNNIVSSIGQDAMNSFALCGRTDQVLFIPAFAISGATISMVGQNYGRGNLARVRSIYARNMLLGLAMVLVLAIVYNMAAEWIFYGFSSVESVIRGSVSQVRALSFTFLGVSVAMISGSTFQATGRPLPALLITLIRMIFLAVPTAYLLVHVFGMKMTGVFIGLGAGNALALPLSWAWTWLHLKNLKVRAIG
ncbi:MAG: MATE family efflux transporter [Spirochaetes bacterium]|nr:MATE family efflux transporter [Spirochaetota bacterium]